MCTSTGLPEAITGSPWLRWSAAARAGHFRTWHVARGMHRIHHGARIHHDLPPARRTAGHAGAGPSHRARGPPAGFVQDPKPGGQLLPERAAPMNHMIAVRRYAAGDAPAAAAII